MPIPMNLQRKFKAPIGSKEYTLDEIEFLQSVNYWSPLPRGLIVNLFELVQRDFNYTLYYIITATAEGLELDSLFPLINTLREDGTLERDRQLMAKVIEQLDAKLKPQIKTVGRQSTRPLKPDSNITNQ